MSSSPHSDLASTARIPPPVKVTEVVTGRRTRAQQVNAWREKEREKEEGKAS